MSSRGLSEIAAYDTSMEGKYVFAVLALRNLEFNLLPQLELQKDASIADIMSLLHLEGPSAESSEGIRLQPSYGAKMSPNVHCGTELVEAKVVDKAVVTATVASTPEVLALPTKFSKYNGSTKGPITSKIDKQWDESTLLIFRTQA
ncbi:hypothetical protein Tco_1082065 [Tanacetum coccineum]|uniref:Uncharacterized protein n=1 Tax=Tanacetum coccineum TaxID=301880 RepID=A0ABQ5HZE5_9ASTR